MDAQYTVNSDSATAKFDRTLIEHHFKALHFAAGRANVPGKLVLAIFGENPDTGERFASVDHFEIGDVAGMTAAAMQFDGVPHRNVYTPLAIMRPDLPGHLKGAERDVVAVLALVVDGDADKGHDAPQPPLPADMLIESSAGNLQHVLFLDRPLQADEAKQFAQALKRATGADSADDISHVWRVPGCLNWPGAAKVARGRAREPQPVTIRKHWTTWTSVDTLRATLAPHWEAPRAQPLAPRGEHDVCPVKARTFHVRLRDAGYYDAGEYARTRYVRAAKALSYDLGDEGRKIFEDVVCWKGEREDEGAAVDATEAAERWKDCSNLRPGTKPITHGLLIDDARKVYGWSGLYLDRDKTAAEMFPVKFVEAPSIVPPCPVALDLAGRPYVVAERQTAAAATMQDGADDIPSDAEDSLALSMIDGHLHELRYSGDWFVYLDGKWRKDETGAAGLAMSRKHVREFAKTQNFGERRKLASAKTIANVEKLARADHRIVVAPERFDADKMLFNTPGGYIDLRTGELNPHASSLLMSRMAAVAPAQTADCPIWKGFLQTSLAGDQDLIRFLQIALGYSLTGLTIEHAMFFLYGTGRNGKGVLMSTVSGICADYAKAAAASTFAASKHQQHSQELARLEGARFVTASETEQNQEWAEARIKQMTGGDPITARMMRQNDREYLPQFKLWIAGNHQPGLRAVDPAIRERMNMIPFTVTIPADKRDARLSEKMQAEWPAILRWMIDGALEWQRSGLKAPAAVLAATDEYLNAQDALSMWVDEKCDRDPLAFASRGDLYASWVHWCSRAGEFAGSQKAFLARLRSVAGVSEHKSDGTRGFLGLKLRPMFPPPIPSRDGTTAEE